MSGDKDQEDLPALNQLSLSSAAATVDATTMTADPEGASKDDGSQDSAGIRAQPVSASAPNATFPSSAIGNKLEDVSSGLGKQDQQDQNQGPGDMTTTSFAHISNSSSDPSAFTPPSPVSTNPFRRSPSVSPRSALPQPELQLYSQPDSPPELPPPPAYVQIEDSTSLESTPALVADVIDPRTSAPALSPQPPSPVATAEASTSASTPAEIVATAEPRMPVVRDAEPTTEYVLKPIDWIDPATGIEKRIKIITQNENGPCPLLALCNTLILQGKVAIRPYDRPTIGYGHLLELLADYLLNEDLSESASNSTPLATGTQRVGERVEGEKMTSRLEIESALRLLPHLEHGLDVNVFFKSIRGFESTAELGLFHTFGVELVHGWVVSPVIDPSMYALVDGPAGVTSYNKAVECIVSGDDAGGGLVVENLSGGVSSISNSNHGSNNSFGASVHDANLTNERVSRALVVQEFMNSTKTQLTHYGLHVLQESLPEGHLCAFFRNNHFCTLFKNPMDGNLYTLVTDQSLAHEQSIVWESLVNVDGAGDFLDGLFRHGALEIGDYARNNQPLDSQHSANGDGGGDEDFALALQLQQQEEEEEQRRLQKQKSRKSNSHGNAAGGQSSVEGSSSSSGDGAFQSVQNHTFETDEQMAARLHQEYLASSQQQLQQQQQQQDMLNRQQSVNRPYPSAGVYGQYPGTHAASQPYYDAYQAPAGQSQRPPQAQTPNTSHMQGGQALQQAPPHRQGGHGRHRNSSESSSRKEKSCIIS
ncbi:hypothetical protein BGZ75_009596 [Mortierella antarctica]|nr:hypothetical protein BGZ75_009596 [Mortierella antarctica]